MALTTVRAAQNDADLTSIGTLFNLQVAGTSIVDELLAEGWPSVLAFTLAVWRPIMNDPKNKIFMGFDGQGTLRGAGWWHLDGDSWEVKLIGIDKRLTAQQRIDGFHDFMQWYGVRVPADTKFKGLAKIGGKLDTYMGARLPASGRTVINDTLVQYQTTAAEAVALL